MHLLNEGKTESSSTSQYFFMKDLNSNSNLSIFCKRSNKELTNVNYTVDSEQQYETDIPDIYIIGSCKTRTRFSSY